MKTPLPLIDALADSIARLPEPEQNAGLCCLCVSGTLATQTYL